MYKQTSRVCFTWVLAPVELCLGLSNQVECWLLTFLLLLMGIWEIVLKAVSDVCMVRG